MSNQPTLPERLETYRTGLLERGALAKDTDAPDGNLGARAAQLAMNFAIFTFDDPAFKGDYLNQLRLFRSSVDSLGMGRDVQVPAAKSEGERVWDDAQLATVRDSYIEEQRFFEECFPKTLYPGIYKE